MVKFLKLRGIFFGLLKGLDMIVKFVPYDHVIYSDGVAYHKISGSIIEGLVKNIVSGVLIEGVYKRFKEGYGRTSDQMENSARGNVISVACWRVRMNEHTNGNIRETGQYQNGERIGIWLSFDRLEISLVL